ncbi:MAG: DUF4004 family protein [Acetivibrio ethanolgignens]
MYISKKELLELTGISYGQLYRWKRERLIPEEWFMKQSSYTGQETFFPREKILERIRFIMEMKDKYSLEEIAELLEVNPKKRELSFEVLCQMEEIDSEVTQLMKKEAYSFIEAAFLEILTTLYLEKGLSIKVLKGLYEGIQEDFFSPGSDGKILTVVEIQTGIYGVLTGENSVLNLDRRWRVIESFSIETILGNLKRKYAKHG